LEKGGEGIGHFAPSLPPSPSLEMFAKLWPRSDDRGHQLPWCLPLAVSHSSLQPFSRLRSFARSLALARCRSVYLSSRAHTRSRARALCLSCPPVSRALLSRLALYPSYSHGRLPAVAASGGAADGTGTSWSANSIRSMGWRQVGHGRP
jgi:hypothetical protein